MPRQGFFAAGREVGSIIAVMRGRRSACGCSLLLAAGHMTGVSLSMTTNVEQVRSSCRGQHPWMASSRASVLFWI